MPLSALIKPGLNQQIIQNSVLDFDDLIPKLARRRLLNFVLYTYPEYEPYWFHKLICDKLDALYAGRIKNLMVFVPAQHGKTELVSRRFPAFCLGRNPDLKIAICCYSGDLASNINRHIQRIIEEPSYHELFPETQLSSAKTATKEVSGFVRNASEFEVVGHVGSLKSVGVMGALSGNRVDIAIIDDPIKDAMEGKSSVDRARKWDWYNEVLNLRLHNNSRKLLIMCMTGDTMVLMADRSEKPLSEIIVGDMVATFDNGEIGVSTVLNWKNQGGDHCYEIKTASGITVKANERHPFLVYKKGELKWVRLKDLRKNDKMIRVGVCGKGKSALSMGAKNPLVARDIVDRITINGDGEMVIVLHQTTRTVEEQQESKTDMELTNLPPQNTYEIILDEIDSISFCGIEDVFDIQVERTENFVANGLVSHNTRWNEDDLAGRILAHEPDWEVVSLPYIKETPPDETDRREIGEALWPERHSVEKAMQIKRNSERTFASLCQQRPAPAEGGLFKRSWFKFYKKTGLPVRFDTIIQSWDCTFKDAATSDYVVGQVWGKKGAEAYLIDMVRGQWSFTDTMKQIRLLTEKYPISSRKLIEDKANGTAIIELLKKEISGIIPISPTESKESRASAVSYVVEAGNIFLPEEASWVKDFVEELCVFPNGRHDDMVDALSQALNHLFRGHATPGLYAL